VSTDLIDVTVFLPLDRTLITFLKQTFRLGESQSVATAK